MLTLFPRIKPNAMPPPAPPVLTSEPIDEALLVRPVEQAADSRVDLPASTSAERHAGSVPEVLAEIPLLRAEPSSNLMNEIFAEALAERVREPAVVPSESAPPTAEAHAPQDLDIGEWDAAAEPEPVIATKPEMVFEAFASALHSRDGSTPASAVESPQQAAQVVEAHATPVDAAPEIAHAFQDVAPQVAASEAVAPESVAIVTPPVETPEDVPAVLASEQAEDAASISSARAEAQPPAKPSAAPPINSGVDPALREALVSRGKPNAPKGSFFVLPRVPEPEAMEDSAEVEAYASAAAQSHLDAIDDTFVAHAQLLLKGRERGRALDIGTGPGQIVLKLGYQLTRWKFVGADRSAAMIAKAQEGLATAPELAGRVDFVVADGNRLNFPGHSFDLVMCNSVLHHMEDPQKLFAEMARLVKPGGAILLRDLLRPTRLGFGHHVRKHGKHYNGEMKRLFVASLRAAYTEDELQRMVDASPLRGVTVFSHRKTHVGFQRAMRAPAARPV
jgi:ubiquinone/menaquinone biosynthesis C-methylase UbiE